MASRVVMNRSTLFRAQLLLWPYVVRNDAKYALHSVYTRRWIRLQHCHKTSKHHHNQQKLPSIWYDISSKVYLGTTVLSRNQYYNFHTTSADSSSDVAVPSPAPPPASKQSKEETPVERAVREAKEAELAAMEKAWREAEIEDTSPKEKKSIMTRIKHELVHYWHGTKLLGAEVAISSRIIWQVLNGHKLSRREERQLRRTTGDMLRLVPFLIFLIVPFLEFTLPIFLRFFPNMLPSTFESKVDEQTKKKRQLQVRLEMAKFLQDTIEDVAVAGTSRAEAAKEFSDFFLKYRTSGEQPASKEIINIARKFEDNLTLNNISRPQLVSMCKYMNINAFGTDNFLRNQIERKMRKLRNDDKVIAEEGIESLNVKELQQACSSRGIRTVGVSIARLRSELSQWLDLHLHNQVPSTLLILSRAFTFDRSISRSADVTDALQAALHSLPHQVVNEAALGIAEAEGKATYKQKLEVLKEQEELIDDENEQEEALLRAKNAKVADETARKKAAVATSIPCGGALSPSVMLPPIIQQTPPIPPLGAKPPSRVVEAIKPPATFVIPTIAAPANVSPRPDDKQAGAEATKLQPIPISPLLAAVQQQPQPEDEDRISDDQLKQLGAALKALTADSVFQDVRTDLAEIKLERAEFKEDIEELKVLAKAEPSSVTARLGSRVDNMLAKIEKEIASLESTPAKENMTIKLLKPDQSGFITLEELEAALKIIKDHPADERIRRIVQRLDTDGDGKISLDEIMGLAEQADSGAGIVVKDEQKEERKKVSQVKKEGSESTTTTCAAPSLPVSIQSKSSYSEPTKASVASKLPMGKNISPELLKSGTSTSSKLIQGEKVE